MSLPYSLRPTVCENPLHWAAYADKNQTEDIEEKDIIEYIHALDESKDGQRTHYVNNDELLLVNMYKEEVDFMIESLSGS